MALPLLLAIARASSQPSGPFAALDDLTFVPLHGPNGQTIYVNPREVTSLREPQVKEHFGPGTRCLIYQSNARLVAVQDSCESARNRLQGSPP
jgi:hypothetical protein